MRLQATLTREDLQSLVSDLAPATIRLGQKGKLTLSDPSGLELVANCGVRFVCQAQGSWEVLGVSVPIALKALSIRLEPTVEKRPEGDALVFKLHIESAEIAMVPGVIGERIVEIVNGELREKHGELAWSFGKTLSHVFRLPASLANLASIGLVTTSGTLKITTEALVFSVAFDTHVGRKSELPASGGSSAPS